METSLHASFCLTLRVVQQQLQQIVILLTGYEPWLQSQIIFVTVCDLILLFLFFAQNGE